MTTASLDLAKPSRDPGSRIRILGKSLLALGLLAGGTLSAHNVALDWNYREAVVAHDRVDIGGRTIALTCTGSGERTFVLEAGATGFAETFAWVQDGLDDDARVCAYDRAGLGASDPNPEGFSPEEVVHDLAAALALSGEEGPYVLVGHSLGGVFVRDFALTYPEEVEALVLIDSSHEDQLTLLSPEEVAQTEGSDDMMRTLGLLSRAGLTLFTNPLMAWADGLPESALAAAEAYAAHPAHLSAAADEVAAWEPIMDRVRRADHPAELPILAVSAGTASEGMEGFVRAATTLRADLAARSNLGQHHTLPEADHFSIIMDEEQASSVVDLIEGFVATLPE